MTQTTFIVSTAGPALYEVTREVANWTRDFRDGLLTLMIRHTSASLLIQENADPDVQADLHAFYHQLVPPTTAPEMSYLRHRAEGPDDMPAHIKAAMLPISLSIPVIQGCLRLGTWQGIYVFEHRTAPHRREIAAHFAPS
ncbi:MAG: secondary thiamine-phosphate synthase enzyme YjbQ [Pseudomonadota bacterium]